MEILTLILNILLVTSAIIGAFATILHLIILCIAEKLPSEIFYYLFDRTLQGMVFIPITIVLGILKELMI